MNPRSDAIARLAGWPRTPLAELPTPLRPAPRLAAACASRPPTLWIKHDDLTGFGLGGNKVRKLEFELSPDRLEGVTHLVTPGGPQSNHCRVTAAAAARLGLGCVLVIGGAHGPEGQSPRGNALLHRLYGAEILTVPGAAEREAGLARAAKEIEDSGSRALVVPLGASTPLGALGYAAAALELLEQLPDEGPVTVYLASSSAGTLGGLAAGLILADRTEVRLVGVSADVPADVLVAQARRLAIGSLALLGVDMEPRDIRVAADDAQIGAGYGVATEGGAEATHLFATEEGVVLDPVYTAKAGAALVESLGAGAHGPDEMVVFLHTGGHPAVFR